MDIDWTAIRVGLAAPFGLDEVEFKPGRGGSKNLIYVDARAVQDRLDDVVGPGHWAFDWTPLVIGEAVQVVKGTLTIHGISKSDIGDGEKIETSKAAVSDALKRAAVMWGIGRYLYGLPISNEAEYKKWLEDGTLPGQRPAPPQQQTRPAAPPAASQPPRRQPTAPALGKDERDWDGQDRFTSPADVSPLTARFVELLTARNQTLAGWEAARAKETPPRPPWADLTPSQQQAALDLYERQAKMRQVPA